MRIGYILFLLVFSLRVLLPACEQCNRLAPIMESHCCAAHHVETEDRNDIELHQNSCCQDVPAHMQQILNEHRTAPLTLDMPVSIFTSTWLVQSNALPPSGIVPVAWSSPSPPIYNLRC